MPLMPPEHKGRPPRMDERNALVSRFFAGHDRCDLSEIAAR
jgi:hypothetical protein